MMFVLAYLAESGSAESGEVAESLNLKAKHASMVLLRSRRRGFTSRQPYKRGRAHGYVYQLTEEGAKWLLYKASQKTDSSLNDCKSAMQITNKNIYSPRLGFLEVNQNRQNSKDSILSELFLALYAMQTADAYARRCHSLEQLVDLAVLALAKASRNEDEAVYFYLIERAKNRKLLEENERIRTGGTRSHGSRQHKRNVEGFAGLEVGIELGKRDRRIRTACTNPKHGQ